MAIEILYGGLKLIDSGTIICSGDKEVLMTIENIKIKLIFETDKNKPNCLQDYKEVDGVRVLKLINYNDPQGVGFKNMWDLGNGYFFDYLVVGFPMTAEEGSLSKYMHFSVFKS